MMRRSAGVAILGSALLLVSGCATKDWVQERFGKTDAEIDQRFGKLEGRMNEGSQRLDAVSGEVKGVGAQVKSIEGGVIEARTRADAAMTKAESVDGRLTRLWANRYSQKPADTVEVYFAFGKADLSDGAQTALLGVVEQLKANPGLTVDLAGYTDIKGPREYNYRLSHGRVEAVRRFLAEKGIQLSRIRAVALGPITVDGTPEEKKRRVTIQLMVDQD